MRHIVFFSAALLLLAGGAEAQTRTGILTGHVTDASGAAVPGATVSATSPALIEGIRTEVTTQSVEPEHHSDRP